MVCDSVLESTCRTVSEFGAKRHEYATSVPAFVDPTNHGPGRRYVDQVQILQGLVRGHPVATVPVVVAATSRSKPVMGEGVDQLAAAGLLALSAGLRRAEGGGCVRRQLAGRLDPTEGLRRTSGSGDSLQPGLDRDSFVIKGKDVHPKATNRC